MLPRPILNRIPGELKPVKCDHYIQDLTKLTRIQLLEIKQREERLMSRIPNLNKLPDKGKRIKDFYEKVCKELEKQYDVEEAAEKFSEMNIAKTGQAALNKMEWNGKLNGSGGADDVIDSDDEAEMDPLKIIAQRSMHEKNVKVVPIEESLITAKDLEEIESFASESVVDAEVVSIDVKEKVDKLIPKLNVIAQSNGHREEDDPHLEYLVRKGVDLPTTKEKFKPYQTTISDVHNPAKEKQRKQGKFWENTAATPPPIQHGPAQMLSLKDSVEIQKQYLAKLKDLQQKQAAARLEAKLERMANLKLEAPTELERKNNPLFNQYRVQKLPPVNIEGVQEIDEEDEIHDIDCDQGGGVTYTVFE